MKIKELPRMSQKEINMILKYLKPTDIMLEWGAGNSTIYFSQFVKKYYSIETIKNWFDKINNKLEEYKIDNVELYYQPAGSNGMDHVNYHESLGEKYFDVVLVDCANKLSRPVCAINTIPYLKGDSIVIVHDYYVRTTLPPHRGHVNKAYLDLLNYFDIIDGIKERPSIAIMRKK